MPMFRVVFARVIYGYAVDEIEADDADSAEREAARMLEEGEIYPAFESEDASERVLFVEPLGPGPSSAGGGAGAS